MSIIQEESMCHVACVQTGKAMGGDPVSSLVRYQQDQLLITWLLIIAIYMY